MNVLVSRCLLGINCRYDGDNNEIKNLKEKFPHINFIDICPEVDGGMETPRKPCEIKNKKVLNIEGENKTKFFKKGAKIALKKAKDKNVKVALLKSKSPSCGKDLIYDGSFSNTLIKSHGITCKILSDYGIVVFSEKELDDFQSFIALHS